MEESEFYRVVVSPSSKYRRLVGVFLLILALVAVYYWPYYFPLVFKLITACSLLVLYTYTFMTSRSSLTYIFCNDDGEFLLRREGCPDQHWQISSRSYFLPFVIILKLRSDISPYKTWFSVYTDQIDQTCVRRLRRIVLKMKSAKVSES